MQHIWERSARIGMMLFLTTLVACATSPSVKRLEDALTAAEISANEHAEEARQARDANPTDPKLQERLVTALLDASRFTEAYEESQTLREMDPHNAGYLAMLGHACFGLGLFDEAAACFLKSLQIDPDSPENITRLAEILHARGNGHEVLSDLSEQGVNIMLLCKLEAALDKLDKSQRYDTKVHHSKPVVSVDLSDSYKVDAIIGGKSARLLFDTGASGLLLGDIFATRAHLESTKEGIIQGAGDTGLVATGRLVIDGVQLGALTLDHVSVQVVPDLGVFQGPKGFDGIIGPDILPGWSYAIDRKNETLTFYAPGTPMPIPDQGATTQKFYRFGHLMFTDTLIQNRVSKTTLKVKMVVDTGASHTIYNRVYAATLGFGNLDTTQRVTMRGVAGSKKDVIVKFSTVILADAGFEFEQFLATTMPRRGSFIPYGYLGRDILREFRVYVDTAHNKITFALYP